MATDSVVTVTNSPTLLYASTGPNPETVILDNEAGGNVTLGGKSIIAGNGPLLKATNPPQSLNLYEDAIYGIVASGTARVTVAAFTSSSR